MTIHFSGERAEEPEFSPLAKLATSKFSLRGCTRLLPIAIQTTFLLLVQACGSEPISQGLLGDVCSGVGCADTSGDATSRCPDEDGDGYFTCDVPDDEIDCDDTNALIYPSAPELCDDEDNDCNGNFDEAPECDDCVSDCNPGESRCVGEYIVECVTGPVCSNWATGTACPDGLGCFDGECTSTCLDADNDGYFSVCDSRVDCDDNNATVYPRALELCDTLDNDCDGQTDESNVCEGPCVDQCVPGVIECSADGNSRLFCTDGPAGCLVYSAPTPCPNGLSCFDGACTAEVVCVDRDGDGLGEGCAQPDCNDANAALSIGQPEVCDGLDNNCNGATDEGSACDSCTATTTSSPVRPSPIAWRTACGSEEYFGAPSLGVSALVLVDGPSSVPTFRFGSGFGAQPGRSTALGHANAAVVDAGQASALTLQTRAGQKFGVGILPLTGTCEPDAYEPNNSPLSPMFIGSGPVMLQGTSCGADLDFYEVDFREGAVVSASLLFDGTSTRSLSLAVWRNGVPVSLPLSGFAGEDGASDGRHTHFRMDLPGRYVIAVTPAQPGPLPYLLSIQSWTDSCADDASEGEADTSNDTLATAQARRTVNSTICPGDYDVISLGTLRAGSSVPLDFASDRARGLVDFLVVRDDLGTIFYSGQTDAATVNVRATAQIAGEYFIVLYGRDVNQTSTYTFTF